MAESLEAWLSANPAGHRTDRDGAERKGKVMNIYRHSGLERVEATSARAGDIICLTGIDKINISDTLCAPESVEALPALSVDEPTSDHDVLRE